MDGFLCMKYYRGKFDSRRLLVFLRTLEDKQTECLVYDLETKNFLRIDTHVCTAALEFNYIPLSLKEIENLPPEILGDIKIRTMFPESSESSQENPLMEFLNTT